ncbi:MAG: cryptochrome/photolyase family protein [Desulfobacteraceae bacterium]|nr:MAG: cryptochrome/photolyase family protein [Desulfobacteraceae bacterium]
MARKDKDRLRNLVLVFGDQLSENLKAFNGFDARNDAVLMMEVEEEATYVPQHKIRIALFFAAMRHFAHRLRDKGYNVLYSYIDDKDNRGSFAKEITRWIHKTRPRKLVCTLPGDHRVKETVKRIAAELDFGLEIRDDNHFLVSAEEFSEFARGKKSLLLEHFYRHMRRRYGILMDDGQPVAGKWNFDQENRQSFGKEGPAKIKAPRSFRPDESTEAVLKLVNNRFSDSPGSLDKFDYPVSRKQALEALRDFINYRLPDFGPYQDAMFEGFPYLYHSRLSCALNLHLLTPQEVIKAVVKAYEKGQAPINSVEGFVRQVLGWREFIRGIYWLKMPEYAQRNELQAELPMPAFMWTAETEMNCIRQCVSQLIVHGYAHHIQRLMVMGLFSLLLGVNPYEVHQWHLSMYVDAIDWVSLPNVLGMSQYADGGFVATKPYAASGNYIQRMSNYCQNCFFNPRERLGELACPFNSLYWDFLFRNQDKLEGNHRMRMQYRNLDRIESSDRRKIQTRADELKKQFTRKTYLVSHPNK